MSADAAAEADVRMPGFCNADFPCFATYQCTDMVSYVPVETRDCHSVCGPGACAGETCAQTGPAMTCPDATLCVPPTTATSPPLCAPNGDVNCIARDSGAGDAGGGPYAAPPQAACTAKELTDFVTNCNHGAPAACAAYVKAHNGCVSCLSESLGPYVQPTGDYDVAACLALVTGDSSPSGCAARRATLDACLAAACEGCGGHAPLGPDAMQALATCRASALATTCATTASADCAAVDAGPAAICYETDPDAYLMNVGAAFCASGG